MSNRKRRHSFADLATGSVPCNAPCGCDRPAKRGGKCWGHVRQRQNGVERLQPLDNARAHRKSPLELTLLAAERVSEAEDDDEHEAALEAFKVAARRWVRVTERKARG